MVSIFVTLSLAGFWKVPSTASLHSGVHTGTQWAECWDGSRQEVCPQVRNLHPLLMDAGILLYIMKYNWYISFPNCVVLRAEKSLWTCRLPVDEVYRADRMLWQMLNLHWIAGAVVSNLHLFVLQHARANRAVPSPTGAAKPGGSVSRRHLFLLWGVH